MLSIGGMSSYEDAFDRSDYDGSDDAWEAARIYTTS